ncbi:hypothetical protein F4806DRAFT_486373 [Annulohypoxylon nitens]|nr:hypothetical protein F4806DRAFT_486373 [Annulohypoxylon nitens]
MDPDPSISSSPGGLNTPTSSNTATDVPEKDHRVTVPIYRETVPWPGGTYIIRDPKSGRNITMVDGSIRLEPHLGDQGGYHWRCIVKNNWFGFRSPIDGFHLGHDDKGNVVANQRHHQPWEFFIIRGHPDGGQQILTRHGEELWVVCVGKDGYKLTDTKESEFTWEFVKV